MKKYMMIMVLIFCLIGTKTAYAIYLNEEDLMTISETSYTETNSFSNMDGKRLIPLGAVQGVNDIYELKVQKQIEVCSDCSVTVEDFSFEVNGNVYSYNSLKHLFNIDYKVVERKTISTVSFATMSYNDLLTIEITVTMNQIDDIDLIQSIIETDLSLNYTIHIS